MGVETPEWLFTSFEASMLEIGATASPEELYNEAKYLLSKWSTSGQHKKAIRHLIGILTHIDELSSLACDTDVLCVAAWYFGVSFHAGLDVYLDGTDPAESTAQCAYSTREHLLILGIPDEICTRIINLIKMTVLQTPSSDDVDAEVLSDANLAFLAATPQEYKKQRSEMREDYPDLEDLDFCRIRRLFVQRLLAKSTIFHLQQTHGWETRARENLTGELARLNEEIHTLDPSEPVAKASDVDEDDDGGSSTSNAPSSFSETTSKVSTKGSDDTSRLPSGAVIIRHQRLRKAPALPQLEHGKTEGIKNKLPTLNPSADQNSKTTTDAASNDASSLETAPDLF